MRLGLILGLLALFLVACGDGEDLAAPEETPIPDLVTLDQFQLQVNQLCVEEHERVDALFTDFPDKPTPRFIQSFIGDFATSYRTYREGLVAVGAPEGREDDYAEYLEVVDSHLAELESGAEDRKKAIELFNQGGKDPAAKLETRLGLDTCASR